MDNDFVENQNFYTPEDLKDVLKLLWSQQILWTRFFIVSAINRLPDLEVVTNRLLESPKDFANVFKIYYGDVVSNHIEDLLREHLTLTIKLINSYISQYAMQEKSPISNMPLIETPIIKDVEKQWYDNARRLATYLSSINPYWDKNNIQSILYNHLDMTKDEILKRLYGQYAADVFQYDFIEYHALMIAEVLADGIIKQFYPKS